MTSVGSALSVSEGAAGLMVTVPSIVAAFAAPLVPMLVGSMDRCILLLGPMALMTVSHLASALAPNFAVLVGSRVLVGIAIGGFWAVVAGLAVRLAAPADVPRATAVIFGGVGAANVYGVPLGTLVGDLTGWRIAFSSLSAPALVTLIALLAVLPGLAASQAIRPKLLMERFRSPGVRDGAHRVRALRRLHVREPGTAEAVGGRRALRRSAAVRVRCGRHDRQLRRRLGALPPGAPERADHSVALAVAMPFFLLLGGTAVGGATLLIVWGLSYGGVRGPPDLVDQVRPAGGGSGLLSVGGGVQPVHRPRRAGRRVIVDTLTLQGMLWLGGACALLAALAIIVSGSRRGLVACY
ncbi:MFS transporter [Streptomyces sp. NPDC004749]